MTENEKNEDFQNIDDLIDYNDFESKDFNSKLENESDSFNENIAKFYENHKKKQNNNITNEVQNINRPISSYKRLKENKRIENSNDELNFDFPSRLEIKTELSPNEIVEVTNIITRLNQYFITNGITLNNFCDNLKLLLNFEDFCELFKKIRFEFNNKKDAMLVFMYNNLYYKDGYISIETFVNNFKLEFEKEKIENIENVEKNLKEGLPNIQLVEEFKKINSEIFDLIRNDQIEEKKKSFKLRIKSSYPNKINQEKIKNKIKNSFSQRPSTLLLKQSDPLIDEKSMKEKFSQNEEKISMSQKMKNYLRNSLQKKRDEEISIRESLNKQQNQYLEDCYRKMNELNKMCRELKISKNYALYKSQDNELKCRVYKLDDTNEEHKFCEINLKGLNVEWRMLYKIYLKHLEVQQNTNETNYTLSSQQILNSQTSENKNTKTHKFQKNQIKKEIEKMLISSIRLKSKLKQQVDSLKKNIVIDENFVLQELKKSLKLDK